MIDVTVMGTVKRRQGLTRAGAKPGDDLYVSGTIGAAAAGLRMVAGATASATQDVAQGFSAACVERYLRPEPRVRLGLLLSRNRAASACVDLSDGLADGAQRIAEASGVGVMLDAAALPIDPAARACFEAAGLDPIDES